MNPITYTSRKKRLAQARTEEHRNQINMYHRGLDQARLEVAVYCILVIIIKMAF